jgi:hypothetical protein
MNNVSGKNKFIILFIIGLLIFPFMLIMILIENYDTFVTTFFIMPFWLIFFWGCSFMYLSSADISINETNDVITLRTVFYERKISLDELEIINHVPTPRRLAFIFYTNKKKIILNYTKNNYNIMVNILKLKKYDRINQFIADVEERVSFMGIY